MNRRNSIAALMSLAVLGSACGGAATTTTAGPDPVTTAATQTTIATTTTTEAVTTTTSTTLTAEDWVNVAADWTVSLRRVGPYTIGMSIEEAQAAGPPLRELEGTDPSCTYFVHDAATGLDRELRLMIRAGTIARIDIDGAQLKTLSGVGNGSTEQEVLATYGEKVVDRIADEGSMGDRYVTYVPLDDADANFRLRFETLNGTVVTYRIGRLPEVEWLGRCL